VYRYTDSGKTPLAPPEAHEVANEPVFRRDAPTVLSYAVVACYTLWLYAFGPALTLLRGELHFSYTLLGAYSALWSGGAVLAGVGFPLAARKLSRAALLWCSALLAAAGAGVFTLGGGVASTLAGAGILGLGGTMLLTVTQAILSDRHGSRRERALTEANVGAGACAVLAPLALGALALTPAGWRAVFAVPIAGLAALYLFYRRHVVPAAAVGPNAQRHQRLPLACWLFTGLVAASMAVEFCLIYFGAGQLTAIGLSTTAAATAMSAHYLGILIGRVGGAIATRRPGRSVPLVCASLAITLGGFLLFWLTALPAVAVLGLLLAGLGLANLYPLSLALTLGAASGREDQANARTQLLGGLLVIAAPYLLGTLADGLGLVAAFAIEPVLIGLCLLLLLTGLRASRRSMA
jgi:MFS family permease